MKTNTPGTKSTRKMWVHKGKYFHIRKMMLKENYIELYAHHSIIGANTHNKRCYVNKTTEKNHTCITYLLNSDVSMTEISDGTYLLNSDTWMTEISDGTYLLNSDTIEWQK